MPNEIDIPLLYRLWHDKTLHGDEVAARLGVHRSTLSALARQHGLRRRPPVKNRGPESTERQAKDPTPDEIAERAAAIRATWGPERFRLTLPG